MMSCDSSPLHVHPLMVCFSIVVVFCAYSNRPPTSVPSISLPFDDFNANDEHESPWATPKSVIGQDSGGSKNETTVLPS